MIERILLCVVLAASVAGAQDTSASPAPKRDFGLDVRIGVSRPIGNSALPGTNGNLELGSVPTFNVDARLLAISGISAHFTGELLARRPAPYSADSYCEILCDLKTSTAALQAGLTLRATRGPVYAALGLAERATVTVPTAGCHVLTCPGWPLLSNASLRNVPSVGLGFRPRGSGIRPTAEVNVSFYHVSPDVYRRDLEIGGGIAF